MKDKEVHNSHKRKEEVSAKGVLFSSLSSLALTAVCIVFEVLCLKYFKTGFIAKNLSWLLPLVVGLTVAYCLLAIFFAARGKSSIYRVLFSGYLLLLFFLVLLFILQKTGFLEIFQSPDRYKEYLESAAAGCLFSISFCNIFRSLFCLFRDLSALWRAWLCSADKSHAVQSGRIILGSLTAFIIGRKIGYKAVAWMVGKEDLDKWLKKVKGKDNFILTAMFMLPLFPDDMLCFVAGLSSMTWQYFVVMIVFAGLIGIAGTCYSVNFIPFNTWWGILIWAVLIAALVAAFVFLYKNMDAINSWFNKKFKFARRKKAGKASGKSADEKEKDKE